VLENVNIGKYEIGVNGTHGFWVREDAFGSLTIHNSKISEIHNDSAHFSIDTQ
jgi:hypothetical protein